MDTMRKNSGDASIGSTASFGQYHRGTFGPTRPLVFDSCPCVTLYHTEHCIALAVENASSIKYVLQEGRLPWCQPLRSMYTEDVRGGQPSIPIAEAQCSIPSEVGFS